MGASNNELVRTKTLVKGAIVQVDATPFRQWYEAHYGVTVGRKQFDTGRLLAAISSRPGQCGRCDGFILEGKELGSMSSAWRGRRSRFFSAMCGRAESVIDW